MARGSADGYVDECTNIRILYSMFFRYMFSITTFVPFTHKARGGIGGRGVRGVETCGGGSGSGCERAGRRAAGQGEAPITPRLGQGTAGDNEK